MPVTKQAEKKMRHDRVVNKRNSTQREAIRATVKIMRTSPSQKNLRATFAMLDKGAKTRVIHKNVAARIKSRLSKLLSK
jgi:small subunit ribosomal protein S20